MMQTESCPGASVGSAVSKFDAIGKTNGSMEDSLPLGSMTRLHPGSVQSFSGRRPDGYGKAMGPESCSRHPHGYGQPVGLCSPGRDVQETDLARGTPFMAQVAFCTMVPGI
jgi:hypothetical protein